MSIGQKCAFTLIELLIVVAIIAILALIAVPNFLEAQTRSKVAHVRANLRTVNTAMEAYHVDHNAYPPWDSDPSRGRWFYGSYSVWRRLTSPISYTSPSSFEDVFRAHAPGGYFKVFAYLVNDNYNCLYPSYSHRIPERFSTIKIWSAHSNGPDFVNNCVSEEKIIIYDPSNGTVSGGDIWLIDGNNDPDGRYQWP